MTIKDYFGNDVEVKAYKHKYYNGNLAIQLNCVDGIPWARLTVNFDVKLPPDMAYVDTNNCPEGPDFIEENGLGEFAYGFHHSRFCDYPLYKFDLSKLEENK